jgi:methionyl aminopeptidase
MIQLKSPEQLQSMRRAGLVVGETLQTLRAAVAPGVTTEELDDLARQCIEDAGATPSFLGYHGYPKTICASVNEEIVHGIPRPDKRLASGDIISIDCGAIVDGWHGDSAITVPVGEIDPELKELLAITEESMWAVFARARLGMRMRDLGAIVERVATPAGFGIVDHYGGHGIGTEMHQDPHVLNHGRGSRGPKLVEGMALAIEPMLTVGDPDTLELADGWTVITTDRSYAAHFEHTFTMTADGPWVLTALDGGAAKLAEYGVTVASIATSENLARP